MNLTPKTLKAIAYTLILIQAIALIYMIKATWRNENEFPLGSFIPIFILPLFSTLLLNAAKKKSDAEKRE